MGVGSNVVDNETKRGDSSKVEAPWENKVYSPSQSWSARRLLGLTEESGASYWRQVG